MSDKLDALKSDQAFYMALLLAWGLFGILLELNIRRGLALVPTL